MRNVYKEYRLGLISWDTAFAIANNNAASMTSDTDYWAHQMESLGVDVAEVIMSKLGYLEDENGNYFRPD